VGYGTALAIARSGAIVTVVGRNATTGRRAVRALASAAALPPEGDGSRVRFVQGDIGTVKSALALVGKLEASDKKYDLLVVTAAVFPNWDASLLNEDGIDKSFAIAVVGRFLIYSHMHRFLKTDGSARVLNVLASGMRPPSDFDRELASGKRLSSGLFENMMMFGIGNEIMQIGLEKHLSEKMKQTTRVSTHPGILKTDLHNGQGLLFDIFERVLTALSGVTEEKCGMTQASILASEKLHFGGLSYVDPFGNGRVASDELLHQVDLHLDWLWSLLTNITEFE